MLFICIQDTDLHLVVDMTYILVEVKQTMVTQEWDILIIFRKVKNMEQLEKLEVLVIFVEIQNFGLNMLIKKSLK